MLANASPAYGVADPAKVRQMSGREFLQAILDGRLPAPPIVGTLSFWLTEIGDGLAVFEGEPGPHLLNPLGIVHGGWAMTLIDSAAGCAAHTLLPAGASYATIETKANFSRPIAEDAGRVRAKDAPLAAGGASSPAKRGSSTPKGASSRTGPRPLWCSRAGVRRRNRHRREANRCGWFGLPADARQDARSQPAEGVRHIFTCRRHADVESSPATG